MHLCQSCLPFNINTKDFHQLCPLEAYQQLDHHLVVVSHNWSIQLHLQAGGDGVRYTRYPQRYSTSPLSSPHLPSPPP